jgi:hypothetical protein
LRFEVCSSIEWTCSVADPTSGPDQAELAAIARHALHDEELIAAFAAGDLDDANEQDRARALVDRCSMCRDLKRDLAVIRTAVKAAGTATERAATMAAPRDFRLSPEDAARLLPGSPIVRVARRLGWRARLDLGIAAFGRPVGAAMATFGVAGLLIGSLTFGGAPASLFSVQSGGGATSAPGAEGIGPAATSTLDRTGFGPLESGKDSRGAANEPSARDSGSQGVATIALFGGSIALIALGIGLFVAARRRLATVTGT